MIPGLTAMVLQVQALLLTGSAGDCAEREQARWSSWCDTDPLLELVLGKIIPYLAVGTLIRLPPPRGGLHVWYCHSGQFLAAGA